MTIIGVLEYKLRPDVDSGELTFREDDAIITETESPSVCEENAA